MWRAQQKMNMFALILNESEMSDYLAAMIPFLFSRERGEIMGAVTTNPWLIAVINMTIVFGVLIALGGLMTLLQLVDPTKKR